MSTNTAIQGYRACLEEVHGPAAETNLDSRINTLAKRRGGIVTVTRRVVFGDGSVMSWTRQPGQGGWIQVPELS